MEGKVITEFKLIELEDGYRIEVKGDKEQLKKWFEHRGKGFGPGMGFGHRGHGFGPFGMFRHGPWNWGHRGPWSDEDEGEPKQTAKT